MQSWPIFKHCLFFGRRWRCRELSWKLVLPQSYHSFLNWRMCWQASNVVKQGITRPSMSGSIFSFATNVANQYGHSPYYYSKAKNTIKHPLTVFNRKAWNKLQIPYFVPNFVQNNRNLRYSIWKVRHSPHSNVHCPHVASDEYVGQRCTRQPFNLCEEIAESAKHYYCYFLFSKRYLTFTITNFELYLVQYKYHG